MRQTNTRLDRIEARLERHNPPRGPVVIFQDLDDKTLYHTHAASVRSGLGHLCEDPEEVVTLDEARRRAGDAHLVIVQYGDVR